MVSRVRYKHIILVTLLKGAARGGNCIDIHSQTCALRPQMGPIFCGIFMCLGHSNFVQQSDCLHLWKSVPSAA